MSATDINIMDLAGNDRRDVIGFFLPALLSVIIFEYLFYDTITLSFVESFIGIVLGLVLYACNFPSIMTNIFKLDKKIIDIFKNHGYLDTNNKIHMIIENNSNLFEELSRIRAFLICFINLFSISVFLIIFIIIYYLMNFEKGAIDNFFEIKIPFLLILIFTSYLGANNRLKGELEFWKKILSKDQVITKNQIVVIDYIYKHNSITKQIETFQGKKIKIKGLLENDKINNMMYDKLNGKNDKYLLGLFEELIEVESKLEAHFSDMIEKSKSMSLSNDDSSMILNLEALLKEKKYYDCQLLLQNRLLNALK